MRAGLSSTSRDNQKLEWDARSDGSAEDSRLLARRKQDQPIHDCGEVMAISEISSSVPKEASITMTNILSQALAETALM